MLKADVYTLKGKTATKIALPKEIFGLKPNQQIIAQAVRVYLANQRQARAKTKTRAQVSGTGAKIYRQKGTGRARHGDRYAPIFVGGGVAHGPTGEQNYKKKMAKKLNRLALLGTLSAKFQEGKIAVVKGLEKIEPKTRAMIGFLKSTKLGNGKTKISLITDKTEKNLFLATRNIKGITFLSAKFLSPYNVLNTELILLTPQAIEELKKKYA